MPSYDLSASELQDYSILSVSDNRVQIRFSMPTDENFLPPNKDVKFLISGKGEAKENCGQVRQVGVSENNEFKVKKHSCHLQGCPICFRIWANKEAERCSEYLWKIRCFTNNELWHFAFNIPVETFTTWDDLEARLWRYLERMGVDKSKLIMTIVRHPNSIQCKYCHHKPHNHNLPYGCPKCKQTDCWEWFHHPHLHCITNFHFEKNLLHKSQYIENMPDVQGIFARLSYIKESKILRLILSYEFGHALYVPEKHSPVIRYFALSSKKHFRLDIDNVTKTDVLDSKESPYYILDPEYYRVDEDNTVTIQRSAPKGSNVKGYHYRYDSSGNRIRLKEVTIGYKLVQLMWYDKIAKRWLRVTKSRAFERKIKRGNQDLYECRDRLLNGNLGNWMKHEKAHSTLIHTLPSYQ